MLKRLIWAAAIMSILVATAAAALVWNEARKEIKFLCGNFGPGVTEQSVVRQLDTGTFLRYRKEDLATTSRIIADSAYNIGLYQCVVELDGSSRVLAATYQ